MTDAEPKRTWIWWVVVLVALTVFTALYLLARETGAPTFEYDVR